MLPRCLGEDTKRARVEIHRPAQGRELVTPGGWNCHGAPIYWSSGRPGRGAGRPEHGPEAYDGPYTLEQDEAQTPVNDRDDTEQ